MTDWRQKTVDTYNNSAQSLSDYFQGIGARTKYIDLTLGLLPSDIKEIHALEIGCGDGRDATDIVTKVTTYTGFDISTELIKLAQKRLPNTHFEVADAVTYPYPSNVDAVFAFASFLHLTKEEFQLVLNKLHDSLNPGGIIYISIKYAPEYQSSIRTDEHGERMFYLYSEKDIAQLANNKFEIPYSDRIIFGKTEWLETALRKI